MVMMTVVVKVRPEKKEEFLQAMRSLDAHREKQKGFMKSVLCQESNNQVRFRLVYEWETQEDLDRYLKAEEFSVLVGALKILCEESEIRYGSF